MVCGAHMAHGADICNMIFVFTAVISFFSVLFWGAEKFNKLEEVEAWSKDKKSTD